MSDSDNLLFSELQARCLSGNHYTDLYNFAPIGYLTLTDDNLIDDINITGATLFGVEPAQLISRGFADYVAPEDEGRWQRNFQYARESGGKKQQCELTLLRADGTVFYAYLDYLYQKVGKSPDLLYIMLADVSDQIELRDYSEIYRSILATTLDGFWIFNSDGKLLEVNSRYASQSGYSYNELLGMNIADLEVEDSTKHIAEIIIGSGSGQFESAHRRKDGSIWHVEVSMTYLDCNGGRFYAFLRDISSRKQTETEVKEINSALNVLLNRRQTDRSDAQSVFSAQVEGTIFPFLKHLKKTSLNSNQSQLLNILETNLQHLTKTYGRANTLASTYRLLTPVEVQVASMIRQGLSTKVIAATLHSSEGTVSIHRKNIRKKLGLNGKTANLSSYLLSLAE